MRSGAPSTASDADRAGKHAHLEAQIRGNPGRDGIVHRGRMYARAARQDRAKPLAALSPTRWHGILQLGSVELLLYHPARLCFIRVRGHATWARASGDWNERRPAIRRPARVRRACAAQTVPGKLGLPDGRRRDRDDAGAQPPRARFHCLPSARSPQCRECEHPRQGAGPGRAVAGHSGADRLAAGFLARRWRRADPGRRQVRRAAHAQFRLRPRSRGRRPGRRLSQDLPAVCARRHGLGGGSH